MEVIALPQRQRRRRSIRSRAAGQGRRRQIGPLLATGAFRAGGQPGSRRTRAGLRFPTGMAKRQRRRNRAPRARGMRRQRDDGLGMGPERFRPVDPSPLSRQIGSSRPGGRIYPFHGDEEVTNVLGGDTFSAVQFPVNPGQATLFPWLSKEAVLYERYFFTQLEFYYQTLLNATSATAIGKVVYSMDFDAADPPPVSKQQAMDSEPAESCAPWENMALIIEPYMLDQAFTDAKYVRPAGLPGGSDIKNYDLGNLNVVTDSQGATSAIGELHVRYAGFFMNRVLDSTTSAPNNNQVSWFQSTSAEAAGATTVAKNVAFATATTNGLSILNTSGSFVPPAGNYLVDVTVVSSNTNNNDGDQLMDVQKNGASLYTATLSRPGVTAGSGAPEVFELSASVFVSANGTDAFTVPVTASYTAGTMTLGGSIRWVAV